MNLDEYFADAPAQLAKLEETGKALDRRVDEAMIAAVLRGALPEEMIPVELRAAVDQAKAALPVLDQIKLEGPAGEALAVALSIVRILAAVVA